MLDRFDARWMLDMTDFSKGAGARVPADLVAEVYCMCACASVSGAPTIGT